MRSDWIRGRSVAKKTVKPTRLPTRKPGIERYNRIIEAADWRDMMLLYVDGVRDFYLNNKVVMILALLPVSFVSVNQTNREFGQALFQLLHSQGLVPKSQQVVRACEMASELADLVWRKSLIEKGTLTPTFTREVKTVVISYLEAVLSD